MEKWRTWWWTLMGSAYSLMESVRERLSQSHWITSVGATEEYAAELAAMRLDMSLTDTVDDFPTVLVKLRLIEDTARDGIADICDRAIAMLENDVWWSGVRFT
jgi:hypothetical protein